MMTKTVALLLAALTVIGCAAGQTRNARPASPATEAVAMKMQLEINGEGRPVVLVGNGLTGALGWEAHAQQLAPMRRVARHEKAIDGMAFGNDPFSLHACLYEKNGVPSL